jgi:hypothetical protein
VLEQELAAWQAAGQTARFWWRDDDAVDDTPQLRRLVAIARELDVGAAVSVVPDRANASLIDAIHPSRCSIWQHGWGHQFHVAGEFGNGRVLDAMLTDALNGRNALDRLFGPSGWQRVFVPPNHCLSMAFKALLPALGYRMLSAGVPLTPELSHVAELNAEVDVMNWPRGVLLDDSSLMALLVDQLAARRTGAVPVKRPIGILTHHLVFDDGAWSTIAALLRTFASHPAARLESADTLLEEFGSSTPDPAATDGATGGTGARWMTARDGVVVVITSCGRQDLLATTLDSFFRFNTAPIRNVVVIEDGNGDRNSDLKDRFRDRPVRWLASGERIGQIAAIDRAYRDVDAEYIFHCEDDWEFYAPGFIEKSLSVLAGNPRILQVWLRALCDTNNTTVLEPRLFAGETPYRLLQPELYTEEWGTWHGFSFNPGLRRRSDYVRLGSFSGLDPAGTMKSWEVERAASEFYFHEGFLVAILADRNGEGYVRHLGWGRRVADTDTPNSSSTAV